MNIVLGVEKNESDELPSRAAALLRRLDFPQASVDVVHVMTPLPYGTWGMDVVLTEGAIEAAELSETAWAESIVEKTAEYLRRATPALPEETDPAPIQAFVRRALSVPEGLLAQADETRADLIAVEGPHLGPLASLLSGSVARSLVISSNNHCLLLVKDFRQKAARQSPGAGPIRAVFATDHSPYANRCLRKLIELAPRGLAHLTVLSAYPKEELRQFGRWLPDLTVHPSTAVRQSLEAHNADAIRKLSPMLEAAGATAESRVIGAPVNEAIAQTMEETGAGLLILGARGHGFLDRLTLGSVSFHQAMTSPYSLLILRA